MVDNLWFSKSPASLLAGLAVVHLACAGCFSGREADDDRDPSTRSAGGSGGTSSSGGSAGNSSGGFAGNPAPIGNEQCTLSHCDCSYCDFNPDYRCVDNCIATCPNNEVGFRCDGLSSCVSVATSLAHCGRCDNPCSAGQFCSEGECRSGGVTTGAGGGGGTGGSGGSGGTAGTAGISSGGSSSAGASSGGTGFGGAPASGGSNAEGGSSATAPTDPCSGVLDVFEGGALGYFCGENLPLSICTPGSGGTVTCSTPPSDRLFLCSESKTVGYVTCADGCHASAAGEPDYCLDGDPCANSPLSGASCGSNLSPLADRNVLYTCEGQKTVATEVCPGGCNAAPLGQNDRCAPAEQL